MISLPRVPLQRGVLGPVAAQSRRLARAKNKEQWIGSPMVPKATTVPF